MEKQSVHLLGGLILVMLVTAAPQNAKADELEDLRQQLAEQQKMLLQMQQKLDALETQQAQQAQQSQALEATVTKAIETPKTVTLPDNLKWVENVKLNGDFRYRYEMIDEEGSDNRNRNRIRARIGITGKVTDEIELGFRLATSEPFASDKGDPVSTNQSLDDAFSKKDIWLDLAYFKWSPKDSGLNVFGGKMENPFLRVGGNELIFDSDLTLEGIAVQYTRPLTERTNWFVNAGGFYIDEVSQGADVSLWGVQGGLKHTFEDKSYLVGGVSKYGYSNIEGHGPLIGTGFQGNSNAGALYTNDYDLFELFGEYGLMYSGRPTAIYANYVKNTVATSNKDTGWLVGGKYGKCKDPGSWELFYDYRDLEADAVLGAFTFSDTFGGGTNGKGHRFGTAYQLTKNTQAGLTYLMNEKGDDSHDYDRLQADLMFKF